MTDRRTELCELADRISTYDSVTDAWLAKSFTDRLLVVGVRTRGDHQSYVLERV